jgi:tetratricopeptide (TPR) repeat protein
MDLSKLLPKARNGHILITTRNPNAQIYSTVGSFQFKGMDPEEAITLLLSLAYPEGGSRSVSRGNRKSAEIIAAELGYLALALKQAAATIRQKFLPLERYLKSLLGCRKALLSRPTIRCATDVNIIATWELPFTGITNRTSPRYQDAVDLIHMFAFMHFASIPASIFSRSSDGVKQLNVRMQLPAIFEPSTTQAVQDRVLTAARVLYEHSIISVTGFADTSEDEVSKRMSTKYLSLHPAIHQWARERLDKDKQRDWLDCVASIIAHSISSNLESSGRDFRRQLLPHIESCISLLKDTYPDLPCTLDHAFNLEKFGLVYAENGLWKRAKSLQLGVVDFRTRHLGKWNVDTINAQRVLANTYWNLFEMKQCLEVQDDIRKGQWWARPSILYWMTWPPWRPVHIPYCLALDDLTRSLWLAGRRELSQITGKRAVEISTKYLGHDDPITLNAVFNLARTYLHLGEHAKSHNLLKDVLDKRMHFFGPEHPDTLMVRNELGMALCAQRLELSEAENHVHSTLESRKKVLGEEHAYTLWSVNDLSRIYCELRRFGEAAHILEEILPVVKRTLGEEHVGMIMMKSNLCRAYMYSERWEEAGKIIRQIRDIVHSDHPDWIHINWGYAVILLYEGKLDEAELCCNALLSNISATKVFGPDHPRVMMIAEVLLAVFRRQGREQDIIRLKERFSRLDDKEIMHSIDHMTLGLVRRLGCIRESQS